MTAMLTNLFQVAVLALAPLAAPAIAQTSDPGATVPATSVPATSMEGPGGAQEAPSVAAGAADGLDPNRVAPHVPELADEVRDGTFWMPVAASELAKDVDATFNFIMWINYVFTALIAVLMVVFVVKYRRRPGNVADQSITHNTPIEIVWSVLPTILVAVIFWQGYVTFLDLRTPPKDALQIRVKAYTWGWNFVYPDGTMVAQQVAVPQGRPVEFIMSSQDTLHSMHLPAFRQKQDVLPDRYTTLWFPTERIGDYRIYCSEYCGKDHSNMYARLQILSQGDYDAWFAIASDITKNADGSKRKPEEIGQVAYAQQYGCKSCHSLDGTKGIGPSFTETMSFWGKQRPLEGGGTALVDDNYIRKSILDPHSELAQGFGKLMTVYNPALPEEHIDGVIAFLKTLAQN
jgi:cytochrome c oxidase subunit 2